MSAGDRGADAIGRTAGSRHQRLRRLRRITGRQAGFCRVTGSVQRGCPIGCMEAGKALAAERQDRNLGDAGDTPEFVEIVGRIDRSLRKGHATQLQKSAPAVARTDGLIGSPPERDDFLRGGSDPDGRNTRESE